MLSVICPVYNEEKYISQCIESLLLQDYPKDDLEILLVDGMSQDKTREIITSYTKKYPFIKMLDNPKQIVPYAMNEGIKASRGDIIIRLDGHVEYPSNYFSALVKNLKALDADNVGALCETLPCGSSAKELAIAEVLGSSFGMGNSYLSGREYLPVDTDESLLKEGQVGYPESVTVESYQKKALQVDMMVENAGVDDQTVQLPMLYYRGYQAEDVDSGTLLQVAPGENHVVSVRIPGEYKGHIKVGFVSPWYYRVSEVISLLSLLCLAGLWIWKRSGISKAEFQKNDLVRSENIELQRKAESV